MQEIRVWSLIWEDPHTPQSSEAHAAQLWSLCSGAPGGSTAESSPCSCRSLWSATGDAPELRGPQCEWRAAPARHSQARFRAAETAEPGTWTCICEAAWRWPKAAEQNTEYIVQWDFWWKWKMAFIFTYRTKELFGQSNIFCELSFQLPPPPPFSLGLGVCS